MKTKSTVNKPFIIDNFYPYPNELRDMALEADYEDWLGPDGQIYKRISRVEIPGLVTILENLFGPIEMLGMGFRLNFNEEEPNAAIHSDLGWGTHALVLYLSDGESGTAFWDHRESQTSRIDVGQSELFEQICSEWNQEEKWKLREFVPMLFNRAIIYESALFHSRYPFKAFGDSPETGRLIAVAFFTPENRHDS